MFLFCFGFGFGYGFWHLDFLFYEVPLHAFFYLVLCHVGLSPRPLALMLSTCHLTCCQPAATSSISAAPGG